MSRQVCTACQRPLRNCICALVHPVAHATEVLILQHPLEVREAKGTARLLHLCLQRSRLEVGECFDSQALQSWLTQDWHAAPSLLSMAIAPPTIQETGVPQPRGTEEGPPRTEGAVPLHRRMRGGSGGSRSGGASLRPPRTVLLYPESPHDPALPLLPAPPLPPTWLESPQALRLVVIDGTWRKSRKMLYLNPWLQQLPRLGLRDLPASRYAIRRAHRAGQLSTLEATCCALAQLEPSNQGLERLLQAMDALVLRQSQWQRQTAGQPLDDTD